MNTKLPFKNLLTVAIVAICLSLVIGCKNKTPVNNKSNAATTVATENPEPETETPEIPVVETDTTTDPDIDYEEVHEEIEPTEEIKFVKLSPGNYDPNYFADSLAMEALYMPMLKPIVSLKESDPKTYWFIVSWLNTAYKTPSWKGYDNYAAWHEKALTAGVDCSGFTRVMCDRIFGTKVSGSSHGILTNQCNPIARAELQKGDLVFFRAPYTEKGTRIVHVGVYLFDNYFVHATSTRSASLGRGLMVSSLNEENWAAELEGTGRIK